MATYTSTTRVGPPSSGHFLAGNTFEDATGTVFTCYDTGFPGGWSTGGGPGGDTVIGGNLFVGSTDGSGVVSVRAGTQAASWISPASPPAGIAAYQTLNSSINTSSASRIKAWWHDTDSAVAREINSAVEAWTTYVPSSDGSTWTHRAAVTGTLHAWGAFKPGIIKGARFEAGYYGTHPTGTYNGVQGVDVWVVNYGDGAGTPAFGNLGMVASYNGYLENFGGAVTNIWGFNNYAGTYGGTVTNMYAISNDHWIGPYDIGVNPVVTNSYGLKDFLTIDTGGTATNVYGVHLDWSNSGTVTNAWGFYQADTRANHLGGSLNVDGQVLTSASTTARAGLVITSGAAPSSPAEGDFWYDGTNLVFRDSTTSRVITWT